MPPCRTEVNGNPAWIFVRVPCWTSWPNKGETMTRGFHGEMLRLFVCGAINVMNQQLAMGSTNSAPTFAGGVDLLRQGLLLLVVALELRGVQHLAVHLEHALGAPRLLAQHPGLVDHLYDHSSLFIDHFRVFSTTMTILLSLSVVWASLFMTAVFLTRCLHSNWLNWLMYVSLNSVIRVPVSPARLAWPGKPAAGVAWQW